MQVLYLGRAPRTKEPCPIFVKNVGSPDIHECFRGLTGSQRTPGFGASQNQVGEKPLPLGVCQNSSNPVLVRKIFHGGELSLLLSLKPSVRSPGNLKRR